MIIGAVSVENMVMWGPYGLLVLFPAVVFLLWVNYCKPELVLVSTRKCTKNEAGEAVSGKQSSSARRKLAILLGPHPKTHSSLWLKGSNEFPYVSDGEHTALLPKGTSIEEVTARLAAGLIDARYSKEAEKRS